MFVSMNFVITRIDLEYQPEINAYEAGTEIAAQIYMLPELTHTTPKSISKSTNKNHILCC
jgi:hypothetical protein